MQEKVLENVKWKKMKWLYKNRNQLRPEQRLKKKKISNPICWIFLSIQILEHEKST